MDESKQNVTSPNPADGPGRQSGAGAAALFFYSARQAVPWFVAFVGLTIVSGLADPRLAASPASIPAGIQVAFFVLNILGVALTAYLLLQYFVRTRDAALARSDDLLLNVLPSSIAQRLKRDPGAIAERFVDRGEIEIKGKGRLRAYLLVPPTTAAGGPHEMP